MNCDTVDSILDDHRSPQLSPTERQDLATHLAACVRCAGDWGVHDALAGEEIAEPPPELFARVLGNVSAARVHSHATRHRGWRMGVAAAAVVALVAVVARYSPLDLGATIVLRRPWTIEWLANAGDGGSPERAVVTAPAAPRFVAGRDYEVLPGATARPALDATGRIEVTEFFMFLCFPCYTLEPDLDRWEAQASNDVSLTRVPAMFNAAAELQARAYYTAEVLGKLDAMHDAFYGEIHERGNGLASRAALADFFQRFGVDAATFDAMFDSSEVDARMQRAVALNREYGVRATPTLVVAGRYSLNPLGAGFAVVDDLVAEVRKCRALLKSMNSVTIRMLEGIGVPTARSHVTCNDPLR